MKRFRFTLAALKTLRERREQEALEAYAQAVRHESRTKEALAQAQADLANQWAHRQTLLEQGVAAVELVHWLTYCQGLQKQCQERENDWALARQYTRQKWELLLVARQKREVVDKFQERQKRRYLFECGLEEQKLLDELAGREQEGALTSGLTMNQLTRS